MKSPPAVVAYFLLGRGVDAPAPVRRLLEDFDWSQLAELMEGREPDLSQVHMLREFMESNLRRRGKLPPLDTSRYS